MLVALYALFMAAFIVPYLYELGLLARQATWLSDLLAASILVIVIFRAVSIRQISIGFTYWYLLFFLAMDIAFGLLLNEVQSGVFFTGVRDYLKFLPLFLLPAVYSFSEDQLRKQLLFLLALALLQLPVAVFQRFVQFSGVLTGDVITGTLQGSGVLTVFLLAAGSFLTGAYLKKLLSKWQYLLCLAAIFIPTTLNETKATIFFLPLALLVPVFFFQGGGAKIKQLLGAILLLATLSAIFVPVYDHFMLQRRTEGILDFLGKEGRLEGYLENTGRSQSSSPIVVLSDYPTKVLLGVGIGNASDSFLGPQFSGAYYDKYGHLIGLALSRWQWEIGLIGTAIIIVFFFLVLRDAVFLSRGSGLIAGVALGWVGVLAVLALSLIYNQAVMSDEVGFLLWYFSGYIAAKATKARRKQSCNETAIVSDF